MKNGKSRCKWKKSKGYILAFLLFFCPFMKNGKSRLNGRKVNVIALLFAVLCPFMKNGKSRLKWTKSKGYSLSFLQFFAPL
jgi:hypothetical protein